MKPLKIILISLLVFIVLIGIVLGIFISRFDLNAYLEPMTKQASLLLGRPVSIEKARLEINLSQGVVVSIDGITVKEDSRFGQNDFLRLGHVSGAVDVGALVLHREIVVTQVLLSKLSAQVIRNERGDMNVQSLGKPVASKEEKTGRPSTETAAAYAPGSPTQTPANPLPPFSIRSIHLTDGSITYVDQNTHFPVALSVNNIDIQVNNFSLTQPFSLAVNMAALSSIQNMKINAEASLDMSQLLVNVKGLSWVVDLAPIRPDMIQADFPKLKEVPLPDQVGGVLTVNVESLSVSPQGVGGLSGSIGLDQGLLKFHDMPVPISNVTAKVIADTSHIELSSLSALVGTGSLTAKASIQDYLKTPAYSLTFDAVSLRLHQVIAPEKLPFVLNAPFEIHANVSGVSLSPTEAAFSLSGDANVQVKEGKIEKINVLQALLDKIAVIPIIGSFLSDAMDSSLKGVLGSQATTLNGAQLTLTAAGGEISVDSLILDTQPLMVQGQGKVTLPTFAVDVSADTTINPEVSEKLVKGIKPLRGLVNNNGNMVILGRLKGEVPQVRYQPDIADITKRISVNETAGALGQQLDKVLDKNPGVRSILNAVFSGDGKGEEAQQTQESQIQESGNSAKEYESESKKLINNFFNKVVK